MTQIETRPERGFWGLFFAMPEERMARLQNKLQAQKKQKETNRQIAKDLRDPGYFDEHMPDGYFYRHYYF